MKRTPLLFTRVLFGEILLLIAMVFFSFTLLGIYGNFLALPYYSLSALYRNSAIMSVTYVLGSKLAYGSFFQLRIRSFSEEMEAAIRERSMKISKILIRIGSYLLLTWGFFEVISLLFLWGDPDLTEIELIEIFVVFGIPSLLFGLRWNITIGYITRIKRQGIQEKASDFIVPPSQTPDALQLLPTPFTVYRSSRLRFILIVLILVVLTSGILTLASSLTGIYLVLFTASSILTIMIWNTLGMRWTSFLLHQIVKKWQVKTSGKSISLGYRVLFWLLGIKVHENYHLYLKSIPESIDLSSGLSVLRERSVELVFTCMAFLFLVLSLVRPDLYYQDQVDGYIALVYINWGLIFSPVAVFWLYPLIWITNDIGLRYIDENQAVRSVVTDLRHSQLNRFLGISGFFAGIYYFLELYETFPEMGAIDGVSMNIFLLVVEAATGLLIVAAFFIGFVLLFSIFYLRFFYGNHAQSVRQKLAQEIGYSTAIAHQISANALANAIER